MNLFENLPLLRRVLLLRIPEVVAEEVEGELVEVGEAALDGTLIEREVSAKRIEGEDEEGNGDELVEEEGDGVGEVLDGEGEVEAVEVIEGGVDLDDDVGEGKG